MSRDETLARAEALKRQAKDKVLLVSPPYAERKARQAFIAGYEAALWDIARGELDVSDEGRTAA